MQLHFSTTKATKLTKERKDRLNRPNFVLFVHCFEKYIWMLPLTGQVEFRYTRESGYPGYSMVNEPGFPPARE
jgi:hypothetical protein